MRRMLDRLALLIVAGLALGPVACRVGPRYERLPETGATLEGTVTYADQKVMYAMVTAFGPTAQAIGYVQENGRYRIENVPLGEVTLTVSTEAVKGQVISQMMAQSQGKTKGTRPKMVDVPTKYAELESSGIKTTINKGENTFDIVIRK